MSSFKKIKDKQGRYLLIFNNIYQTPTKINQSLIWIYNADKKE